MITDVTLDHADDGKPLTHNATALITIHDTPDILNTIPLPYRQTLETFLRAAADAYPWNTVRAWRSDFFQRFLPWCVQQNDCPLPASPETVAAYVRTLTESEKKSASIRRVVASITKMHHAAGVPDGVNPCRSETVRLALRFMAKTKPSRQDQAAPLLWSHIETALPLLENNARGYLVRALVTVAYDVLARPEDLPRLNVEQFNVHDDGSGALLLQYGKTDQEGQGAEAYLATSTVKYVREWLAFAGHHTGPLFRGVSKGGRVGAEAMHVATVGRLFKYIGELAGLDTTEISGHSCRVGAAQDLLAAGHDLAAIMYAGRWKSDRMPARYTSRLATTRGAMAKLAVEQGR